jgi:DNA-nicking Smr family endonuclease
MGYAMGVKKNIPETFSFQPFEGLKKMIEGRGIKVAPITAVSKPVLPKKEEALTDEELFAREMSCVKEIKEFRSLRVDLKKTPTPCKKDNQENEALTALREIVAGRRAINLPDTQEYVEWVNEDYRGAITRLLHEGRFSVKDCLDLHGLSVEESEEEVESFFKEALKRRHKCIKIIHGRGLRSPRGPVLKETLVKRLSGKYRKYVIAFATARQCDGGLGALYILLK